MTSKPHESLDPDARPQRRTFAAEFKARILDEYESAPDAAARGAILRRERLYGSHILDWRKALGIPGRCVLAGGRFELGRCQVIGLYGGG